MTFNTYDFGLFSNGSVTAPVSARYASGITSPVGYIHRVDWDSRLNTSAANTTGCIIGSFYLIESGTNAQISAFVASGNTQTIAYPRTFTVSNVNLTISGTAGNAATPFLTMNPLAITASGVGLAGSLAFVRVHWANSL